MIHGNDNICEIIDGIYLGGIENNVRRTLPLVDTWIYYGYETKKLRDLVYKYKDLVFIKWSLNGHLMTVTYVMV